MTDPRFERNDLPWFARRVVWLLGFTLVVRVGVLLLMPGALGGDPDGYRRLAENVVEYGTLGEGLRPTAYRPPLYPLLLAPCAALGSEAATAAIGGLHVLLGVGTVWLVWRIARRCGWGRWAWLAGALVACDPILLGQSALVMTETAATFFVTLALWALVRAAQWPSYCRLAAAGAALGLCGLCRPELLLWGGACAGSVLFLRDAKSKPSRDREGAVEASDGCNRSLTVAARFSSNAARFFVLLLAVLAPWVARNQIQFGRPIIATTHGGYTLLLANNPSFYDYLRHGGRGAIWDARELGPVWGGKASHDSPAAELAADRRAYAEAWNNIQKQPGMFAYACAARKGRFWALAPHQGTPTVRWAIGVWYLVEFALAVVGLWSAVGRRETGDGGRGSRTLAIITSQPDSPAPRPAPPVPLPCLRGESSARTAGFWLWGLLLAGTMTAVHAVYWSDMRMRAPLVPVVALASAAGIAWLTGRAKVTQVH